MLLLIIQHFADKMMETGDRYEVEIRGCSIWATEVGIRGLGSWNRT